MATVTPIFGRKGADVSAKIEATILEIGDQKFIKITWGYALSGMGIVVAAMLWLTSVDSKATDAINRLDRQKDSMSEMRRDVVEIKDRTSRMEGMLNFIKDRVK